MVSYFEQFDNAYSAHHFKLFSSIVGRNEQIQQTDEYKTPYRELEYPDDKPFESNSLTEKANVINNFVINTGYYQCDIHLIELELMLSFVEQIITNNNRVVNTLSDIDVREYDRVLYVANDYRYIDRNPVYQYTSNTIIDIGDGLMYPAFINTKHIHRLLRVDISFEHVPIRNTFVANANVVIKRVVNEQTEIKSNEMESKRATTKQATKPTTPITPSLNPEPVNIDIELTIPIIFALIRTYYGEILDINPGFAYAYHPVDENSFAELFTSERVIIMPYISESFYNINDNRNNELSIVEYINELTIIRSINEKYNKHCDSTIRKNNNTNTYTLSIKPSLIEHD
jgi:hypothetical protein